MGGQTEGSETANAREGTRIGNSLWSFADPLHCRPLASIRGQKTNLVSIKELTGITNRLYGLTEQMTQLVDIVSSRVKAELLRLLFGLGKEEVHLRELVRRAGLSLGTVQQELRRLTRVGLVLARKDGNRVYYRANADHPVHHELCALVLKTDGLVGMLRPALDIPEVRLAFVFGSVASGDTGASSDVDLMVIGSLGLRRLVALLSGIPDRMGREINSHVMTPGEFHDRTGRRDHFVTSVLESPRLFLKGTEDELAAMGQ